MAAGLMAACMLAFVISTIFPLAGFTFARGLSIFWWSLGVLCFSSMSPGLWSYGKRLSFYYVKLDQQGVEFRFGTAKNPDIVRLPWGQVRSIIHKRVANAQQYTIVAKDGRSATFSSDTFFHTKKIAQLIADHAHLSVEQL